MAVTRSAEDEKQAGVILEACPSGISPNAEAALAYL